MKVSHSRKRHQKRQELATTYPAHVLVLVPDGMDSNKTEIPRVKSDAAYSKDIENTGLRLKTRLMGVHVAGKERGFAGFWEYPFYKLGGVNMCHCIRETLEVSDPCFNLVYYLSTTTR